MGGFEKEEAHERPRRIPLTDELAHRLGIVHVPLPGRPGLFGMMQVGIIDGGEQGAVELGIGEGSAGGHVELVVLFLEHIQKHGAALLAQEGVPVGPVKAVHEGEQALAGAVAAAHVLIQLQGLAGELPGIGHDLRRQHVPAQGLGHQPDQIQGFIRRCHLQGLQGIVEIPLGHTGRNLPGTLVLVTQLRRQGLEAHPVVQGKGIRHLQHRTVVLQGTDPVGQALDHAQQHQQQHQPSAEAHPAVMAAARQPAGGQQQRHGHHQQRQGNEDEYQFRLGAGAQGIHASRSGHQVDNETVDVEPEEVVQATVRKYQQVGDAERQHRQHPEQPGPAPVHQAPCQVAQQHGRQYVHHRIGHPYRQGIQPGLPSGGVAVLQETKAEQQGETVVQQPPGAEDPAGKISHAALPPSPPARCRPAPWERLPAPDGAGRLPGHSLPGPPV